MAVLGDSPLGGLLGDCPLGTVPWLHLVAGWGGQFGEHLLRVLTTWVQLQSATKMTLRCLAPAATKRQDATEKIVEIVRSLERDYDTVWGSMVKQTIRRVFPGFNEEYFGHQSFAEALEAAEQAGAIDLDYDEKRGNFVVRTKRS